MLKSNFKNKHNFEDRLKESTKILDLHPGRVPIICERSASASNDCPNIDKNKFLVPRDFSLGEFMYIIRKRLRIPPEKAIFLFINDNIVPASLTLSSIYEVNKNADGFLYINYSYENTFG